ncbi:coiled-coil domain-containing protein [Ditylenchus destructor]|nr:coiled-coil domain-containing protein [Ditylenchus destructor]
MDSRAEFRISNAASGQFDIREDEEQFVKCVECLELLISTGYFRAKIQGLAAFDKIVGGMVWCISMCAQRVDVDLLYSENSTIGQKIALTERIVEVLPKLNCPHTIEPHQIQGLDCIHIFPVLQWLVKEANEVKKLRGDEQENFAVYQFGQENWKVENDTAAVRPLVKSRKVYRRVIRMKKDDSKLGSSSDTPQNIPELQTHELAPVHTFEEEFVVCRDGGYTTAPADKVIGSGAVSPTLDLRGSAGSPTQSDRSSVVSHDFTLEQLQERLAMLTKEEDQLSAEMSKQNEKYSGLKEDAGTLQAQIDEFKQALEGCEPSVIETVKELLAERDEVKASESAYKRECRRHIEELDQTIERIQQGDSDETGYPQMSNVDTNSRESLNTLTNHLNQLMGQLADLDREIFVMERQVESRPSQIELNQYQRRFVELYNQMSSKHRETKRQYTLYNTLVDVRNFIKREIDLLNSIDDSRSLALKESYKESFVENLQQICKSVEDSLDKILCKKRSLQEQRDAIADNLQLLVDKQRLYMKTVAEFQAECQKNEQMRQELKE